MAAIAVDVRIPAPADQVWDDVRRIATHIEWMRDAVAIRFATDQREGVGTTFECDTAVGPVRLTDRMVVTEWVPGRCIGIRHEGAVAGTGRFTLEPDRGATRFAWAEDLAFPWWLGGRVGAAVGAVVLRRIWRANLRALRARFVTPPGSGPTGC